MTFWFGFWLLAFSKKNILFFLNENHIGFHMRHRLFLHYGRFLQNLDKDFIRTNMDTTVCVKKKLSSHEIYLNTPLCVNEKPFIFSKNIQGVLIFFICYKSLWTYSYSFLKCEIIYVLQKIHWIHQYKNLKTAFCHLCQYFNKTKRILSR